MVNGADKYKDVYSVGSSDTSDNNYVAASKKYGDAVYETSDSVGSSWSWYEDWAELPSENYPFFSRGGAQSHYYTGVFNFNEVAGIEDYECGFRVVIPILR